MTLKSTFWGRKSSPMPSVMYGIDLVLVEDAGLLVLLEHRAVGVDAPDLDAGFLLLQVLADAADRAAGADADHQMIDPAVGLVPDLGPGLLVVGLGVRRVVVLVGLPAVRRLALEPRRHRVVGAGILGLDVGRADDHVGAERPQRVHFLLRLLVGGGEDAVVALDHGGDGQAHPGVARGALDDRPAGLQAPVAFGVLDHLDRHAVLDRVAGVEGLDLGDDLGGDDALRDAVQPHHRRVTDGVEDGIADFLRHRADFTAGARPASRPPAAAICAAGHAGSGVESAPSGHRVRGRV